MIKFIDATKIIKVRVVDKHGRFYPQYSHGLVWHSFTGSWGYALYKNSLQDAKNYLFGKGLLEDKDLY